MSVWVTSLVSTQDVVNLLLEKYKVDSRPENFALFIIRDNGEQRRLKDDEYPLLVRIMLGPHEDVARLFLTDAYNTSEIRWVHLHPKVEGIREIINSFLYFLPKQQRSGSIFEPFDSRMPLDIGSLQWREGTRDSKSQREVSFSDEVNLGQAPPLSNANIHFHYSDMQSCVVESSNEWSRWKCACSNWHNNHTNYIHKYTQRVDNIMPKNTIIIIMYFNIY